MAALTFPNLSRKLAHQLRRKIAMAGCWLEGDALPPMTAFIDRLLSQPNLGCATTGQLLAELKARSDLSYSTVFSETETKTEPIERTHAQRSVRKKSN